MDKESKILTTDAEDVDEFLNLLSKRHKNWRQNPSGKNNWVYRGQWEQTSLSLLPSSLRKNLGLNDPTVITDIVNETLPNGGKIGNISENLSKEYLTKDLTLANHSVHKFSENETDRINVIIKQSMVELLLIKKFIETCNKSALFLQNNELKIMNDSIDKHSTADELSYILHRSLESWLKGCFDMEVMYRVKTYPPFIEYIDYYSLALSQHSGIPTRLLDWTYSSLIAAFFSAYQCIVNNDNNGKLCVYAFNTEFQRDVLIYRNSIRVHHNLKHNNFEFLHVQKGLFTEMRGADFFYLKHGKWPSLDEHIQFFDEDVKDNELLYNIQKVTLPAKFATELLVELALEDVTKATLMPTYFHCADNILKR